MKPVSLSLYIYLIAFALHIFVFGKGSCSYRWGQYDEHLLLHTRNVVLFRSKPQGIVSIVVLNHYLVLCSDHCNWKWICKGVELLLLFLSSSVLQRCGNVSLAYSQSDSSSAITDIAATTDGCINPCTAISVALSTPFPDLF